MTAKVYITCTEHLFGPLSSIWEKSSQIVMNLQPLCTFLLRFCIFSMIDVWPVCLPQLNKWESLIYILSYILLQATMIYYDIVTGIRVTCHYSSFNIMTNLKERTSKQVSQWYAKYSKYIFTLLILNLIKFRKLFYIRSTYMSNDINHRLLVFNQLIIFI